jgi:two-component system OmpR family response regulator
MEKRKIVIIDDEEDLCRLMRAYFLTLDYDVFLAHTLGTGLILMNEISPDIVFLDNNLPDGLGWEKTNYLADLYPNCKINLISAYNYAPPDLGANVERVKIIEKPLRLTTLKEFL